MAVKKKAGRPKKTTKKVFQEFADVINAQPGPVVATVIEDPVDALFTAEKWATKTLDWIKRIEDFCGKENITPDDLIESYKKKKTTLKDIMSEKVVNGAKNYLQERREKKGLTKV